MADDYTLTPIKVHRKDAETLNDKHWHKYYGVKNAAELVERLLQPIHDVVREDIWSDWESEQGR